MAASIAACAALVIAKSLLLWRININWDEFNFLSHAHESARGELRLLVNGAYAHLFEWLAALPLYEADQIVTGRVVMFALFVLTLVLIWRLAAVWTPPAVAWIAPLCYASMAPVMQHGASFRYDSLLAPLTVAVLLLLAQEPISRRRSVYAGLLFGVAGSISIKAILLVPAIIVLALTAHRAKSKSFKLNLVDLALMGIVSAATAAALLGLHKLSLAPAAFTGSVQAETALRKTILEVPFFPRRTQYTLVRQEDGLAWGLMFAGALCALAFARYRRAAACALSLSPLLFYRNAWPYYYLLMLAPASVLAAVAVDGVRHLTVRITRENAATAVVLALILALAAQGLIHAYALRHNEQLAQRAVINGVHQIFPRAVAYIDHSGMISSFRKANFFMSTWGLEEYRKRGQSFVGPALLTQRPPLLLANRPVLDPRAAQFVWLLAQDQELLKKFYAPYWGPVFVAGASVELAGGATAQVELPFPGDYRVVSASAVMVDGVSYEPQSVFKTDKTVVTVTGPTSGDAATIQFITAEAQPPPDADAPIGALYTGL
jgi:hypothetical protein